MRETLSRPDAGRPGRKMVVIGAGSIFFTRALAVGLCKNPRYRGGALSLVDTNPEMLDVMDRLCRRIVSETGADLRVEAHADRKKALPNADFIVLCFSNKGVDLRETETKIPAKYGILQPSGDSIGPGGLFRSIRTIPAVLEVCRDIEAICPDAWVFNYINPTAVIGAAIARHAKLKVLALCDAALYPETVEKIRALAGLSPGEASEATMRFGGVNHFAWLTDFRLGKRDLMPDLLAGVRKNPDPHAGRSVEQILDVFGWYATAGGHMTEFLPYFQGKGFEPSSSYVAHVFPIDDRRQWMKSFNEEIRRQADGTSPVDALIAQTKPDLAVRVADAMIDGGGETHFVNFPNKGHIANLPDGAVVELPATFGKDGFAPAAYGEMPPVLRSWLLRVIDVQELTLEAAMTGSRRALRQALTADPLTFSFETADRVIDELIRVEEKDLPPAWRK